MIGLAVGAVLGVLASLAVVFALVASAPEPVHAPPGPAPVIVVERPPQLWV